MKSIVWGARGTAREFFLRPIMNYKYEVICIVDNDESKWGRKLLNYDIVAPQD